MNYRDVGYAASAAVIWGTLGLFATGLNARGFDAGQVAALRVVISAAALILASPIYLGPYLRSLLTHWPTVVAHSLFGVLFYNIAYFYAIQRVGVAYAVSLLYTAPVWALLFATLFLGESPSLQKFLLALCALVGVALVVGAGSATDPVGARPVSPPDSRRAPATRFIPRWASVCSGISTRPAC